MICAAPFHQNGALTGEIPVSPQLNLHLPNAFALWKGIPGTVIQSSISPENPATSVVESSQKLARTVIARMLIEYNM
jgi:hypothetical protein